MIRKLTYLIRLISGHLALKWRFRSNGIYCFTYHRIGNSDDTQFDPNVFSCTESQFEKHLAFYQKEFKVISCEQLLAMKKNQSPINKRYAVITFDDGYLDNYEVAFPILKKFKLPATFFLTSSFVAQKSIPWWDEIAWMIKNTQANQLYVGDNNHILFDLSNTDNDQMLIHQILTQVKSDRSRTMTEKVADISTQLECSYSFTDPSNVLFMSWEQAKEMRDSAMTIGGHTMNHPILSHLTAEQQFKELSENKSSLEEHLDMNVFCFAYPVGGFNCFNNATKTALNQLDYQLAFSYEPGINTQINQTNQYDLLRFPIESNRSCHRLKYDISYPKNQN